MGRLPLPLPFWRSIVFPGRRAPVASPALPAGEAKLDADSMMAFDPRPGLRILVVEGTLWVTQEGEDQDFIVRRGECFVPASHGKVVAQAMTDVRARICYVTGDRAKVCSTVP